MQVSDDRSTPGAFFAYGVDQDVLALGGSFADPSGNPVPQPFRDWRDPRIGGNRLGGCSPITSLSTHEPTLGRCRRLRVRQRARDQGRETMAA